VCAEVFAASSCTFCAIVAIVIVVGVFAFTDCYFATVVTFVILVCICVCAIDLIATVITVVVLISVFAFPDRYRTAVVTNVILVYICVCAIDFIATVITLMIRVIIFTCANCYGTAIVTFMILATIFVCAHIRLAAVAVTDMIGVFVLVSKSYAGGCTTLRTSCGNFAGCITVGVRGYIFLATYITVVISVSGLIEACLQNHAAAVITDVIFVGCRVYM